MTSLKVDSVEQYSASEPFVSKNAECIDFQLGSQEPTSELSFDGGQETNSKSNTKETVFTAPHRFKRRSGPSDYQAGPKSLVDDIIRRAHREIVAEEIQEAISQANISHHQSVEKCYVIAQLLGPCPGN